MLGDPELDRRRGEISRVDLTPFGIERVHLSGLERLHLGRPVDDDLAVHTRERDIFGSAPRLVLHQVDRRVVFPGLEPERPVRDDVLGSVQLSPYCSTVAR